MKAAFLFALGTLVGCASVAWAGDDAQNDNTSSTALAEAYSEKNSASSPDDAEWRLVQNLESQGFNATAAAVAKRAFVRGTAHRHFVDLALWLAQKASRLGDDVVAPLLLNGAFDASKLQESGSKVASAVRYQIAVLSLRLGRIEDAERLLLGVDKDSEEAARAHYLLGVVAMKKGNWASAQDEWRNVLEKALGQDSLSEDTDRLSRLAHLGVARALYARGEYQAASENYEKVPRETHEWFDAILESGWAYFQQEDYGRALGKVESALAPYFARRFVPEAYLLAATVYYSNCQWDRSRVVLEQFRGRYEPQQALLKTYLSASRAPLGIAADLAAAAATLPLEVVRQARREPRYLRLHLLTARIDGEAQRWVKDEKSWPPGLVAEMGALLQAEHQVFANAEAEAAQKSLVTQAERLDFWLNQARLIKFEIVSAEKEWVEHGFDTDASQRPRLPRPLLPTPQHLHYDFRGEYWSDEIGFYVHALRKECRELK